MTDTIKLKRAYQPVKVELDDADGKTVKYETVPLTRSLIKQVGEMEREMYDLTDEDEVIAKLCEVIDIRLRASNGSKAKPSTMLKKAWHADELTYPELMGFFRDISRDEAPN
jgi:hypothetical protein